MLNESLRELEPRTIIKMGFFIHDLHQQIDKLHKNSINDHQKNPYIVYRGQGLSISDFDKLQKMKGGLISFNSFLSTSKSLGHSLMFADSVLEKDDTVGILFNMEIDPSIDTIPYANIQNLSQFEEEQEILFSMPAVFRIGEITKLDQTKPLYQVQLRLTADNDSQLCILRERMQEEIKGVNGWERLGHLLFILSKFHEAEEIYNMLLETADGEEAKAHYYNQLGYIKDSQGEYRQAIDFYVKGVTIKEKYLSPDDPSFATIFNNIGVAYRNMGKYSEALSFHRKSLRIRAKSLPRDHVDMAQSYNNIGALFAQMGEYHVALSFFQKALNIRTCVLPNNHHDLAQSCINVGLAHEYTGQYDQALRFLKQARGILEAIVPKKDPNLATVYNNLGELYRKTKKYLEALSLHTKALKIREEVLSSTHPDLAQSYNNIGLLYNDLTDYSKASEFLQRTVSIFESLGCSHSTDLAISYANIARILGMGQQWSEALDYYKKAKEIFETSGLTNHPLYTNCDQNIGFLTEMFALLSGSGDRC